MRITAAFILMLCLTNCSQDSIELGEQAIQNIPACYKQTGYLEDIDRYKIAKSITTVNLTIQEWIKKDKSNIQRVIAFIYNSRGYAIPILPNSYKRFWDFGYDNNQKDTSRIGRTFEEEFLLMLKKLNLTDSTELATRIFLNISQDIFGARIIHLSDSTDIRKTTLFRNSSMNETIEEYNSRKSRILKAIYSRSQKSKYCFHHNAFWDEKNGRIFQVDFDVIRKNKQFKPDLKIYRLDCELPMIKL